MIAEDTKSILTDDANKEILSNMTMEVAPPVDQLCNKATPTHGSVVPPAMFDKNV